MYIKSNIAHPMNYDKLGLGLNPPGKPMSHSVYFFKTSS